MKQFIVLMATLPLLLIFVVQYSLDQKNHFVVSVLQEHVYTAKEQAKQEGCFTDDIQRQLKDNIHNSLGISKEDITIEATETRQYRINYYDEDRKRGLIYYRVSVPTGKLMAGTGLLGISEEINEGLFTIEGVTASERIPE